MSRVNSARTRGPRTSRVRVATGFTLLEVLVAAVILGVGLLALGLLEVTSTGTGRDSRETSIATAAADEMIERMRRNGGQLAGYNGFDTSDGTTRPAAAGMLQSDYDQWKARIERAQPNGLRGGRGLVQVTGAGVPLTSTRQVTVTIRWTGEPLGGLAVQTVLFQ